jgi:hypothetical protein
MDEIDNLRKEIIESEIYISEIAKQKLLKKLRLDK